MVMVSSICLLLLLAQAPAVPRKPAPPVARAKVTAPAKPAAKPAGAKPAPFPIRTLKVEGARQLPVDGILAVAGLKIGTPAEASVFEAARERLLATGLFEQAGYRYTPSADKAGFDAVILVTEIAQLLPYRFEDLGVAPALLTEALRKGDPLYGERLSATPVALKRYNAILNAALQAAGKDVPLAGRVLADGPGQLVLVFRPDVQDPTIAQVGFRGNEVLPTALLQTTINGSAIGAVYKEDRMREYLAHAIVPLYEGRGRVNVSFPKIVTTPNPDNKGLDVMVDVVEGPSFELGEIRFVSEADIRELQRASALTSGDLANMELVEEALVRVRTALRKEGYVKNQVTLARRLELAKKPEEKNLIHLDITAKAGPQYQFDSLTIEGLDILNEPPLRKMWSIEPGAPFNGDYPVYFLKRIREDALFDDLGTTKAVVDLDDAALKARVKLIFGKAERKPVPKKKRF